MNKLVPLLSLLTVLSCVESQAALDDARSAIRDTGDMLAQTRTKIVAACVEPTPEFCAELIARFNELQAAYTVVNEAVP